MNIYSLILLVAEAVVILFELRFLMQSSNADYYHPITQAVIKLTQPIMKISAVNNLRVKSYFIGALVISLAFSLIFWQIFGFFIHADMLQSVIIGILMVVKCFGYLCIMLMLIQALTSWLPSTRAFSYYCSQLTYPIVSPVQRIIPPIGMIDLSLMIVMIALFAINGFMNKVFGILWLII